MPKVPSASERFESYLKPIPPDKPLGPHYKLTTAAVLMGKSTKWLRGKIMEGYIDGFLFGHDICVSLESINAYMELCRITGQAKAAAESDEEDADED